MEERMSRIDEFTAMGPAEFDGLERWARALGWPVAFALGLALWAGILVLAL
jgi:hypothetical protein